MFKPNKSISDSDLREQKSVDFIVNLLKGHPIKTEIKQGDKEANIDGYIELLDEDGCINGKLTVQIKTVSPTNEGKDSYPCPTSLFGYADRTMDVVLLLAVDHGQKVVLWKFISRQLLLELSSKEEQQSITLHFKDKEKLSSENVVETIAAWNSLFIQEKKLYDNSQKNEVENNELRKLIASSEVSKIDLPKEDIVKIQKYSDTYNSLLDNELSYIKQWRYPNSWKQGVAIFKFEENELLYSNYSIYYGENSLLIKHLPNCSLDDFAFHYAFHSRENQMRNDYRVLVVKQIEDDIKYVVNQKDVPPLYDYYIMEYLRDFVSSVRMYISIPNDILKDYSHFKSFILDRFTIRGKIPEFTLIGGHLTRTELIFDFVNYLLSRGYKGELSLYPPKGNYGNTGFVYDYYNPETAYEKTKFVIEYVYKTYNDFIGKHFSKIKKDLDMFYNADMVLIDLSYNNSGKSPSLCFHCFYYKDTNLATDNIQIEYSVNRSNSLINSNSNIKTSVFHEHYKCIGSEIKTPKGLMTCTRSCGITTDVLFSRTCLIDTFRSIFKKRLTEYATNLKIE